MADQPVLMSPDERAFRAAVGAEPFSAGAAAGYWRLVDAVVWPHAVIAVAAAARDHAPDEYFFRFELTGYPSPGPTAQAWNSELSRLATEADRPKVSYTPSPFRCNWKNGAVLYVPCDREAAAGHPEWQTKHADVIWDPNIGICLYLGHLHRLLNENAYLGI